MDKPDYVPAHALPAWLSSEDVLAMIRDFADAGVDKAVCWDMTQTVHEMAKVAHLHPTPSKEQS